MSVISGAVHHKVSQLSSLWRTKQKNLNLTENNLRSGVIINSINPGPVFVSFPT